MAWKQLQASCQHGWRSTVAAVQLLIQQHCSKHRLAAAATFGVDQQPQPSLILKTEALQYAAPYAGPWL